MENAERLRYRSATGQMTKYITATLGFAVMVLSGCTLATDKPPKPNVGSDAVVIGLTLDKYVSAWQAADAGRIADLYSDDAVILPGDHRAESGRTAITKYNQDFFDQYTPNSFKILTQDRKIIGDWAFDFGSYTFEAAPKKGGQSLRDRGKYVVIMKRQADGSWKWFRDIDNSDGPPVPPDPKRRK